MPETTTTEARAMDSQTRLIRTVYLTIEGKAPRARKVNRHIVKLGKDGDYALDVAPESLIPLAYEKLAGFNDIERATIHLDAATIEGGMLKCQLLDPRNLRIPLVYKCKLCNQRIDDGKPCGCGARTGDEKVIILKG